MPGKAGKNGLSVLFQAILGKRQVKKYAVIQPYKPPFSQNCISDQKMQKNILKSREMENQGSPGKHL